MSLRYLKSARYKDYTKLLVDNAETERIISPGLIDSRSCHVMQLCLRDAKRTESISDFLLSDKYRIDVTTIRKE